MHNPNFASNLVSAAANVSTLTTEQLEAILAARQQPTSNPVTPAGDNSIGEDTIPATADNAPATDDQQSTNLSDVVGDEDTIPATTDNTPTVEQLRVAFNAAMLSDIYLGNPKRLERLLEALKIPMSNEKDFNQFLNHAKKNLYAKAAMLAAAERTTVVLPTDEEIAAEAKKRFALKVLKEAQKTANEAKKAK